MIRYRCTLSLMLKILIFFSAFVLFVSWNLRLPSVLISNISFYFPIERKQLPYHTDICNIIDTATPRNTSAEFPCKNVSITGLTFPLCSYQASEDKWVSKDFLAGRYWESNSVNYVLDCLKVDQRLEFIDLGANIGGYTLAVAHMGRRVISIEPNPATRRRLTQSIYLGNVSAHVTLVGNAVSDEHATIWMRQDITNRGDTSLLNQKNCSGASDCVSTPIKTITLDDLIPHIRSKWAIIKADIQGNEIRAFNAKGASKFFKQIHVPIIHMEFEYPKFYGDPERRKQIENWLTFWKAQNYTVHHPGTRARLGTDWNNWPSDVVLIRKY